MDYEMKHETMKKYELKKWNYEKVWNTFMNWTMKSLWITIWSDYEVTMKWLWNDYEFMYEICRRLIWNALWNDYEMMIWIDYELSD